jgi:hypothetical protein
MDSVRAREYIFIHAQDTPTPHSVAQAYHAGAKLASDAVTIAQQCSNAATAQICRPVGGHLQKAVPPTARCWLSVC